MIQLDGAAGGGQILRSALSLSMITGKGFRLVNIRGQRRKGGLKRQHLTCVKAAVAISDGSADGAELNATELLFQPGTVRPGEYHFSIGTAGSTVLLAQTLMPALWSAPGPSSLRLEGGTHNSMAPTADYLARVFLPQLQRMGIEATASTVRHGFVPAGGGELVVTLAGSSQLKPLHLLERGEPGPRRVDCLLAHLDTEIGTREVRKVCAALNWPEDCATIHEADESTGPGNVLEVEQAFEFVSERAVSFGAVGRSALQVVKEAAKHMGNYLASGAVTGLHLSDQLLLPMALAGQGSCLAMNATNHVRTNIQVIEAFLDVRFALTPHEHGVLISCE